MGTMTAVNSSDFEEQLGYMSRYNCEEAEILTLISLPFSALQSHGCEAMKRRPI